MLNIKITVGTFGDVATFSFIQAKTGAMGDAGAIITNDNDLAENDDVCKTRRT